MRNSLLLVAFGLAALLASSASGIAQQTAAPVFSLAAGSYNTAQKVGIRDATPGARIYYTLEGETPTTSSTRFSGSVLIKQTRTLQAIAVAPGHSPSSITSASYALIAATPVLSPGGGFYPGPQTVTITDATPGATIHYALHGNMPTASSAVYTGPISVSGTETIKAVAVAAGFTQSGLAAATYTNVPTAVAPVLTPQGGDYPSAIYVSMSDGTAKAKIHYTLDGTEPTTASPTYSSPILVTSNETVKAIASVRGYANSLKSTAAYNISIPNRVIETIAGDGTSGYRGDGGLAVHARLSFPTAVAVDKAGNLYIADNGNNVIRKISADSGKISTVAGNGNPGFQGDGTAATKAELSFPVGVAVDEEGDLYIADLNNQRIRKVTASTGLISTVAGNGYYGNGNGATDGVLAENYSLSNASGVAADNSGDFYIANTDSNQVLGVASTGILNAFAGNVNGSTPESGLSALNVDLYNPAGVSFDGSDDIYITDSNGNLVTKVSIGTGILTLVAGTARQGYSGDGGLATDALLDSPENVSIDKDGNVYIADAYNNVIREVFAASGIITTVAGNGHGAGLGGAVGGYSGDGGPAASAELYLPTGVAVDAEGNMYIADSANNAIRKVTVTGSSAKKYSSEH